MSAIFTCDQAARRLGSDPHNGGVKYSGDIVKAIVAGADVQ